MMSNSSIRTILKKILSNTSIGDFYRGKALFLKWSRDFIPAEREMFLLRSFLQTSDTIFDIGANIGEFSFFLSTIIQKGTIHCFEPQKRPFNTLRGSVGGIRNVRLHNIGFSNFCGHSILYIPVVSGRESPSEASLDLHFNDFTGYERRKKSDGCVKEKIRVATIDAFCRSESVNAIAFMKIDVEGHELEVLRGAKTSLPTYHPILLIEIFPYVYPGHFEAVIKYLRTFAYTGYVLSGAQIQPLTSKNLEKSKGFNYFFVPQEKISWFLGKCRVDEIHGD